MCFENHLLLSGLTGTLLSDPRCEMQMGVAHLFLKGFRWMSIPCLNQLKNVIPNCFFHVTDPISHLLISLHNFKSIDTTIDCYS